jgi:hypothetical protein
MKMRTIAAGLSLGSANDGKRLPRRNGYREGASAGKTTSKRFARSEFDDRDS